MASVAVDHQVPGLVRDLGGADGARLDERAWTDLRDRRRGLLCWHLGTSTVALGKLTAVLSGDRVRAPRTGHLSDWADIMSGRSTIMDYNNVICGVLGIGRPLLYDFTQTETARLDGGDRLFLPGSLLDGGVREELPLFRWSNGRLRRHDRHSPLFVPYVETAYEGSRLPLTRLHRARNEQRVRIPMDHHSALCLRRPQQVRELLLALVGAAGDDDRKLGQVFDRVVHREGEMDRVPVRRARPGYRAGDAYYPTAESLVEASQISGHAAQTEGELEPFLRQTPDTAPLPSVDVVALLHAFLGTHRRDPVSAPDHPVDVHVHWGALAMAGCPPKRRGYFMKRANSVRWMYDAVVRDLPWASPVAFVMAPIAPYLLWAPETRMADIELLGALIGRVNAATSRWPHRIDRCTPIVGQEVARWLAAEGAAVSGALRQQFGWADRTSPTGAELPVADLVAPAGFTELTMAQACLLVGAIMRELGEVAS